jgi:hypothetical protein
MEAYAFASVRREQKAAAASEAGAVIRRRAAGNGGFTLTATKAAPKAVLAKGKAAVAAAKKPVDAGEVIRKAGASAFRGGVAGMVAGVAQAREPERLGAGRSLASYGRTCCPFPRRLTSGGQVGAFMWMRTVMNYQACAAGFACSCPLGPILRADAVPLRSMPTAARW